MVTRIGHVGLRAADLETSIAARRAVAWPAARCPGRRDRISETKLNRSGTRQIGRRRRDVKAWRRDGLRGGLHSDTLTERLELADEISLARFRVVVTG